MQITEGKAFPVGPSKAYAADVERTLGRLEKQEKSAASALNQAGKRTSQVAATSNLASTYTGAASSLGKLDVSPADALLNAQLVDSLRAAGGAYKKAASEGRSKDRAGYKREGSKRPRRPQGHERRARRPDHRRLRAARRPDPRRRRRSPACRR